MSERVRNGIRHTQLLHMRRMGWEPLPQTVEEALRDPYWRTIIKAKISDAAKAAEHRANLIESRRNKVWTPEEWNEHQSERGCA